MAKKKGGAKYRSEGGSESARLKADARPSCVANVEDLRPQAYDRGPASIAGVSRDIGAAVGTERIGVDITEIAPGRKSSYLHTHSKKEEFFYVLSGRCRLKLGGEDVELRAGDAVARPAGTGVPHQFFNPYDEACRVLMFGVMTGRGLEDEVVWPELKRRLICDAEGARRIEKL